MPNGYTNTTGSSISRGTRRTATATPLTLADMMQMSLSELERLRLDELEGSSWRFQNGSFNNKYDLSIDR